MGIGQDLGFGRLAEVSTSFTVRCVALKSLEFDSSALRAGSVSHGSVAGRRILTLRVQGGGAGRRTAGRRDQAESWEGRAASSRLSMARAGGQVPREPPRCARRLVPLVLCLGPKRGFRFRRGSWGGACVVLERCFLASMRTPAGSVGRERSANGRIDRKYHTWNRRAQLLRPGWGWSSSVLFPPKHAREEYIRFREDGAEAANGKHMGLKACPKNPIKGPPRFSPGCLGFVRSCPGPATGDRGLWLGGIHGPPTLIARLLSCP